MREIAKWIQVLFLYIDAAMFLSLPELQLNAITGQYWH
jgi:hypothetical protein